MLMTISVRAGYRYSEEAKVFVSTCPRFGVFSQGETQEEAIEAIASTMALYLETALYYGLFEETLRKAGFVPRPGAQLRAGQEEFIQLEPETHEPKSESMVDIQVPIHLIAQQEAARTCPRP